MFKNTALTSERGSRKHAQIAKWDYCLEVYFDQTSIMKGENVGNHGHLGSRSKNNIVKFYGNVCTRKNIRFIFVVNENIKELFSSNLHHIKS